MKLTPTLVGALVGSLALTLLHETGKRVNSKAPRMDLLGMEFLSKQARKKHIEISDKRLFKATLAGDILSNALYYSLAGIGSRKNVIFRGGLLGLIAGVGVVILPKHLNLNPSHSSRTAETQVLAILLYTMGGIVSGTVMKFLNTRERVESSKLKVQGMGETGKGETKS
jgi:hypothetical protein